MGRLTLQLLSLWTTPKVSFLVFGGLSITRSCPNVIVRLILVICFFPRYSNTKPALVLLIPLHHEQETWWQGSSLGMMRSPELPWLLSNAPGLVTSPLSWTRKTIINECLNALICLNSLVEVYPVDSILNTSVNIWDTDMTNSSTLGKLIPCFTCQKPHVTIQHIVVTLLKMYKN